MDGATRTNAAGRVRDQNAPRGRVKWVGLDVANDRDRGGVLDGASEATPRLERIAHDEVSIRRLVSRLGEPARLRACYEAGPTGYELHRLLTSTGWVVR